MRCTLTINGAQTDIDVEPRDLLVDLLRERLGLTGTKVACDTAQCGSCVVELDGATVKSCQVLAVQANGSAVVTIEGIEDPAGDAELTDLQNRLWRTHGSQCGFCTPGMVMTLRELLSSNSAPTESQVRTGLAGNLCRCTGYAAIVEAVVPDAVPGAPAAARAPRSSLHEPPSPGTHRSRK
jgi:carbon-monoxide dehydrogenase small subunit